MQGTEIVIFLSCCAGDLFLIGIKIVHGSVLTELSYTKRTYPSKREAFKSTQQ